MVLELYTPVESDIREVCRILYDGFSESPVSSLLFTVPVTEKQIELTAQHMRNEYGKTPGYTMLAVKDTETGKLISFAEWELMSEKTGDDWDVFKERPCPPGWNQEYFNYSTKISWQSKVNDMGKQPYIYLSTLATPAEYRRRGAGSMLMKALLSFQEKTNLPLYLLASPDGTRLYPKFGFKEVSRAGLDISSLNLREKERVNVGMICPAPRPDQPPSIPSIPPVKHPFPESTLVIKPMTTLQEHMSMRDIREVAFGPNELIDLCFRNQSSSGTEESRASRSFDDSITEPRHRWIGAYDASTGQMLGAAHWYFVDDPDVEHFPHGRQGWAPGTYVELADAHFGEIERMRVTRMKGKRYAYMCLLVVDPSAQRRGVGSRLLGYTLKEVDRLGWESWIEATPDGLGLYKKLGWEVKETLTTDLKKFGGTSVYEDVILVRMPQGSSGNNAEEQIKS